MNHKESTTVVEYIGFWEGFWRGAIGFGVGGAVAVGAVVVGSMLLPFLGLGPLIGFAIGGAIGGASLHKGRKVVIGFGIGWAVLGFVISITLVGLQGGSGEGNVFEALLVFALNFAIGFGIAAAIGTAFMRLGLKFVFAAMIAFGIGWAIGGAFCMVPFLLLPSGSGRDYLILVWIFVGILVPHIIGGGLLGAKIASLERQGEDEERRA